jgi:Flp pilus assembly protein TadD
MSRTAVVAAVVALLLPGSAAGQTPAAGRQLVVPFENTGRDPRGYWLGEASAVILTDDLIALGVPAIRRDDRLRALERLRVPAVATLSHATIIRLGQIVGAGQVVVGGFALAGERLTIHVRAIRLDTGRITPEIVEAGPVTDIFGVYARVARRLFPDSRVSAEEMEQGHPPIAAFEQYIKGLLAEAPAAKIAFLTQALRVYPALQRARTALWSVHTDQGEHKEALAAVRQVPADHRLSRQARFLAAVSMLHLGQPQPAFDALAALQREAPDPALLNNLGVAQLRGPGAPSGAKPVSYFSEAARLDDNDPDLFFNLGYAYWLGRDPAAAIYWLREAVRRNPADDAAHYVLGVALQTTGSGAEGAREKELARQLSSEYAEWEKKQPAANSVPRGLERVKTDLDVLASLRVDNVIVSAGQRDQRELAAFHLDAGRRAYQAERDVEAIAELRRAVYLSPYDSEAHLLLGRAYLRSGRVNGRSTRCGSRSGASTPSLPVWCWPKPVRREETSPARAPTWRPFSRWIPATPRPAG